MSLEDQIFSQEYWTTVFEETKEQDCDALLFNLGRRDYDQIFALEESLATQKRKHPEYKDIIFFMDHEPTINFGRKPENNQFLDPTLNPYENLDKVQAYFAERGLKFSISPRPGGPAYLGPGQLIIHPIVHCARAGIESVSDGQHKLDLLMQSIARRLGVSDAHVKDPKDDKDKRDVYLPLGAHRVYGRLGTKIGSKVAAFKGIDMANSVMFNGCTLFLTKDATQGFSHIPVCGYPPEMLRVASLQDILEARKGRDMFPISLEYTRRLAKEEIEKIFGYKMGIKEYLSRAYEVAL